MKSDNSPLLVVPKDSKDLPGLRGFFGGVQQLCSAASTFDGPVRQMMDDLKTRVDAALSALPTEDSANWSVNDKVSDLLNLLGCSNNLAAGLLLEINKMKQQMAGVVTLEMGLAQGLVIKKEDVAGNVAAAIAERTGENGDLTTKTLSQQLCSASHQKGIEAGIAQRNQEIAAVMQADLTAATRKTTLTTAGLPLPLAELESILRADAAAFDAAQATAADRVKKLTEAGLELPAELLGNVWRDDAGYKNFESTVTKIPALKKPARVDEPFAGGLAGGGGKMIV